MFLAFHKYNDISPNIFIRYWKNIRQKIYIGDKFNLPDVRHNSNNNEGNKLLLNFKIIEFFKCVV